MAGQKQCFQLPGLLVWCCLLGMSVGIVLEEEDWEDLREDLATLHRLKGLTDRVTYQGFRQHRLHQSIESEYKLVNQPMALIDGLQKCEDFSLCVMEAKQELEEFLADLERQKVQDKLLSAEETFHSYDKKLILVMDEDEQTHQTAKLEYSIDPHYSMLVSVACIHNDSCLPTVNPLTVVKVFGFGDTFSRYSGSSFAKLMLKTSLRGVGYFSFVNANNSLFNVFQNEFIWAFKSYGLNVVLETIKQNEVIYQTLDHTHSLAEYKAQKRPVDHSTRYDGQHILIMEDDPVVREAATMLYEKHPTVSSVYVLENQEPKLIKGEPWALTEESRLVLVGHGRRDPEGTMRLGGYRADDVAQIISSSNRVGDQIKTISVVACDVGSDKVFVDTLLQELRAESVEAELHLRSALLQVSHSGEKVTVELTPSGVEYRHKDLSKKVVAVLGRDGETVTRVDLSSRGDKVSFKENNMLGNKNYWEGFKNEWPEEPRRFVEQHARQAHTDDLEALAWAFFHDLKRSDLLETNIVHASHEQYVLYSRVVRNKACSLITDNNKIQNILEKNYEIRSGDDFLKLIHHYAKTGCDEPMYFSLHDWIYQVDHMNLYVYPVGKRLRNQDDSTKIKELMEQVKIGSYNEIHEEMKRLGTEDYASFAYDTLKGTYKTRSYSFDKEVWYGTYLFASVFAESARNFRTLPTVLMALDICHRAEDNNVKDAARKYLIEEHPMATKNSWVSPNRRGFYGTSSEENSSKLGGPRPQMKEALQKSLKLVTQKEETIIQEWMSVFHIENIEESIPELLRYLNHNDITQNEKLIKDFHAYKERIAIEPPEMNIPNTLGGNHDGFVTSRDSRAALEVDHSLKMSSYYSRSSAILAQQIHKELQTRFGERVSEFTIKPDSIHVEDGRFHCELVSRKDPAEILKWHTDLSPASKGYMDKLSGGLKEVYNTEIPGGTHPHQVSVRVEQAAKAIGTVGLIMGFQGAVHAFEAGDRWNGTIAALQTTHGITGMTLAAIGKNVDIALMKKPLRWFMKGTMKVIPIVGIGFGIYSVDQDLKRGDTLGYIDAALDLAVVELDVVEMAVPELAPILMRINLVLSAVRMVDDYIYEGIQTELSRLPKNAGFFDKLRAGIVGFSKGSLNFLLDVASIFYSYPYREIENGRLLVEQISDYGKYYSIREEGRRNLIDFTGGESSWNGGNITFRLSDWGYSKFCMDKFVSSEKNFGNKCWPIHTANTTDIVVGIGESHHLTHQIIGVKVLCFIKVRSVSVISGYEAEANTRFGTYYGNSDSNQFYTVQKAEDQKTIDVMLSYYYELYGENGDDVFFLGPQRSYVEGRAGKDTYIIPAYGGNTVINNYDPYMSTDLLMLSVRYNQISVTKSEADVTLKYCSDHNVRIMNWFTGEEYRHLNLMSADGVLFEISLSQISSVQLIARGVNKLSEKSGQVVDTTDSLLWTVTNIQGSPYDDVLIGNEQNNLIDGGGGTDHMVGGLGEDIYVIKRQNSAGVSVRIDNNSTDSKVDLLLVEAKLHDFKARVDGNDLIMTPFAGSTSAVILLNWFLSENHRHLLVVTEDFISFTAADDPMDCQQVASGQFQSSCLISQSVDYTTAKAGQRIDLEEDKALRSVSEVRGSNFSDVIRGNAKHNMIVPGQGTDFMQGKGGEDWYVVSPGQGTKTINNHSPDMATDILLLKARYSYVSAQCDGLDAVLYINNRKEVILEGWFQNKQSQHLQVQTDDGYVFRLESNVSSCDFLRKYPVSVDFRKRTTGQTMLMDNDEFSSVVEMYGSSGFDVMIGNDQDNMLDPYTGGARMEGGKGKDTYVIKPGNDTKLEINNCAEDESVDVVMFEASFQLDNFTVKSEHQAVLVSARAGGQKMQVRLLHYATGKQCQHLRFQTTDGVHFLVNVPEGNESRSAPEPRIVAFKIGLNDCQRESHTDLDSVSLFSQIGVVHGCPYFPNHIQGNRLENALFGGIGNDTMDGGSGDDTLMGGKGDDILLGETGDDTLYGEEGDDYLLGGAGRDVFIPGPGKDMLDGGPGRDTVLYQGDHETGQGVYVNLLTGEGQQADADGDVLKDVENVIGTIYPDILVSGYEPAFLKGSDGNDILVSLAGGDYLIGGNGNDMYLLASYTGSLVIDNCAEDNATDVLYLHHLTDSSIGCSYLSGSLSLSTYGPSYSLLEVELRGWTVDEPNCRHLLVVLNNSTMVSVEDLVKQCELRRMLTILTCSTGMAVITLLAVGIPLLMCRQRRRAERKERDVASAEAEGLAGTETGTETETRRNEREEEVTLQDPEPSQ
ncbi:uncharacterized protein LOC118219097 isoform X2 [Anguilla anguilla]|uniref:uncharacterized protein LOC118219097 isoform X2 n=1 Tax=Anguilla anguilla TaxID=7936 RepID=UPI0015AC38DA|nr:uncharacterized protein LOC118219097 isoform X2 [Anguilla anguilla]